MSKDFQVGKHLVHVRFLETARVAEALGAREGLA